MRSYLECLKMVLFQNYDQKIAWANASDEEKSRQSRKLFHAKNMIYSGIALAAFACLDLAYSSYFTRLIIDCAQITLSPKISLLVVSQSISIIGGIVALVGMKILYHSIPLISNSTR